jgi:hypothetical protein
VALVELATKEDDEDPFIGPDGTWLYYGSSRNGNQDIWFTSRRSIDLPFDPPTRVETLSSDGFETGPCANASHTIVCITRNRENDNDVYCAARDIDGVLGEPAAVAGLNSVTDDEDPWLSPDGTAIYFSSNRGGDNELYVAIRE